MKDVLKPTAGPAWTLQDRGYDPVRERGVESRFAIANGFLGMRGLPAIACEPAWTVWPRTYVAGVFDIPGGSKTIPALVPAPDRMRVTILVDGAPLLAGAEDLEQFFRWLDMRRGALLTCWHPSGAGAAIAELRSLRLASMADRQTALQLLRLDITAPAEISLQVRLPPQDAAFGSTKIEPGLCLWRTRQSGLALAVGSLATLELDGEELAPVEHDANNLCWRWRSSRSQIAWLTQYLSFARGDDPAADPSPRAYRAVGKAQALGWRRFLNAHEAAWQDRWRRSDIEVEGDGTAQAALRFALYHLNSAANPADARVSIGARALTGDDYLGHVFWDTEIFLLPFYTLTWPDAARALLMYRYRGLDGARAKAAQMGWRGAFFAWESAGTGAEAAPSFIEVHGEAVEITTGREEEHISADVAYAVWHYWQATGDDEFLVEAGAEILIETARFWASRAILEPDGRRHIRDVEGPDEYHMHIDDNAFTNVMARWNLWRGIDVVQWLRERWPGRWADLAGRLSLEAAELQAWRAVAETLVTGFDARSGLFEQFAGYFNLEPIDLSQYPGQTKMDVVLGRERTQKSQVIKQADVVALMTLLPEEFKGASGLANFRFYAQRCAHGSSLSAVTHALAAARLGETELALSYFRQAAAIDLEEPAAQSAGGVHIAMLGGLWQVAVFGFGGLSLLADTIAIDPRLPAGWVSLSFPIQWRDRQIKFRIEHGRLAATLDEGEPVTIVVAGRAHRLTGSAPLRVVAPAAAENPAII
jgi:trehalose/maltose hydrolase-like predicted phosphorylase